MFSASGHGPWITDCARVTECHRIRRSAGLPDYGLFQAVGTFVSGQSTPSWHRSRLSQGTLKFDICLLYTSPSPRD
eukprot:14516084-Alexandrium_andersonii.AAC.1